MTKRQDIQGLRAVAVIMVVAFHAGLPLPGGFSGVDVFFVISGFVISRILLREIESTGTVALGRFFVSRIKRLVPALTVALLAVLLAALLLTIGERTTNILSSAYAALLMYANAYFHLNTGGYFDVQDDEIPLLHTWTLSVEAQFYVAAPLALLLVWRVARTVGLPPRRAVAIVTALTIVGGFLIAQLLAQGHTFRGHVSDPQGLAFYASPTRAWEFLLGTLVALSEPRLAMLTRARLADLFAGAGLLAVVAAAFAAGKTGPVPGTGLLLPVGGATLLIAGITAAQGVISRALSWRPLTFLGDLSYSWYLWHWPFIVFGALAFPEHELAVVLALASLLPAWLSFRFVESRVRTAKGMRGWRVVALGAACVALIAAGATAVGAAQPRLARAAGIPNLVAALAGEALADSGHCQTSAGVPWTRGTREVAFCTPAAPKSAPRVLLVGDSQADAYAYGLLKLARSRGMRLDMVAGNNCLIVPVKDAAGALTPTAPGCEQLPGILEATVKQDPPAVLVVAQSANYEANGSTIALKARDQRVMAAMSRRATEALTRLAKPIIEDDGDVLFLRAVPVASRDGSTCGTALKILLGQVRSCLSEPYPSDPDSALADPYWHAALAVGARTPHTATFDPASLFCRDGTCSQIRAGQLAYRDGNHLSIDGANALSGTLGEAIDRASRRDDTSATP